MVRGKSAAETREMFHIQYNSPNEGTNIITNGLTNISDFNDIEMSNEKTSANE